MCMSMNMYVYVNICRYGNMCRMCICIRVRIYIVLRPNKKGSAKSPCLTGKDPAISMHHVPARADSLLRVERRACALGCLDFI